jgi:DNA modification methylase
MVKARAKPARTPAKRCNDLPGDQWLRYSLSIWSDIRKTAEEASLGHPAIFPAMLCERIMSMFLRRGQHRILDPFMGTGATLVAAQSLGKAGIGFEINSEYVALARQRLTGDLFAHERPACEIHQADARTLGDFVPPASVDLCITSPPYWDILNQRRTADGKAIRHYGNLDADLGTIADYEAFLASLDEVFAAVFQALKPRSYCAVVVMDLRKKNRFFPYHADLARRLEALGFVFDDMIIWDRRAEYNNLRPLGYPAVFRVNKVHEFVLIFQKPASNE